MHALGEFDYDEWSEAEIEWAYRIEPLSPEEGS
jgi:hypothetical protein